MINKKKHIHSLRDKFEDYLVRVNIFYITDAGYKNATLFKENVVFDYPCPCV